MLPLEPQRVAELQRRLAARQLREEDFQMLPDLLAWFRQLGQLLSEEDLTDERLQAGLLGRTAGVEEASPMPRGRTAARRVRDSQAAARPRHVLESGGREGGRQVRPGVRRRA
jgi:hypothetical protein